jgi:DNA-nicking Smr family endonuclease
MARKPAQFTNPASAHAEVDLFRAAVADARPLASTGRVVTRPAPPPPVPKSRLRDERQVLADSLSDHIPWEDAETGEELRHLRPGLPRDTLRRLRRGQWAIRAELDLHGLTREEARAALAAFLHECRRRDLRCVRIIHGKGLGSKNREPVLKQKVRTWLMQRDDVLAFVEARPCDGGSGAVLVLLRARDKR